MRGIALTSCGSVFLMLSYMAVRHDAQSKRVYIEPSPAGDTEVSLTGQTAQPVSYLSATPSPEKSPFSAAYGSGATQPHESSDKRPSVRPSASSQSTPSLRSAAITRPPTPAPTPRISAAEAIKANLASVRPSAPPAPSSVEATLPPPPPIPPTAESPDGAGSGAQNTPSLKPAASETAREFLPLPPASVEPSSPADGTTHSAPIYIPPHSAPETQPVPPPPNDAPRPEPVISQTPKFSVGQGVARIPKSTSPLALLKLPAVTKDESEVQLTDVADSSQHRRDPVRGDLNQSI